MNREFQRDNQAKVLQILEITQELYHYKDVDSILDKILLESRRLANADAGSIYLCANGRLKFSYVQNDTLFAANESNVALYADISLPLTSDSIVGHVALTGETVLIENAYAIPAHLPYGFNPSFDRKSGYRTVSMLNIPLKTFEDKLVGVMQLINAKDGDGRPVTFSEESRMYVPLFANHAAMAIERGLMNRELILRMMQMAQLRDPSETGSHVQRVGAYSAEIYQRWALNHGVDPREVKRTRDLIRLASMLHDVGKVGIADAILKKPGKLTAEEFETMKQHTVFGARLFHHQTSELDQMSFRIALGHHEKWAGGGYPGKLDDLFAEGAGCGEPQRGLEIPLSARITALADVFDALSSRRCYKEAWPEDRVLETISKGAGVEFDPEIVAVFFQIYDIIKAIQEKYRE